MRHYLRSVHEYFRTIEHTVRSFFRPLHSTWRRVLGVLALIVVPTGLAGWGYYAFATSAANTLAHQTTPTAPVAPSQVRVQAESQPLGEPVGANQSGTSATDNSTTQVQVNGQNISVPTNGSTHKEIATENGTTSVDISSNTSSSGSSQSTFNMQLEVNSHTESRSSP